MGLFGLVYEIVKQIPRGKVASYGDVAEALGNKRLSRQVGWALNANPSPETVPCHRVVFKDGGINRQKLLLEQEGVKFDKKGRVKPCFFINKII